jgi:photosystem II stability/assembly factor-like uncharacterized protein
MTSQRQFQHSFSALILLTVFTLLLLLAPLTHAGLNQWTTNGPKGGAVTALAIAPSDPLTLYAATAGNVFRSTNGGGLWELVSRDLHLAPAVPLVVDPTNARIMYSIDANRRIIKTVDGGPRWTAIITGLPDPPIVTALVIDPISPHILYVGTYDRVFKSTNAGASWSALNTNFLPRNVLALAISASTPHTLYVLTGGCFLRENCFAHLYTSTNAGESWTGVGNDLFAFFTFLVIDPTNPVILYAGKEREIIKSVDGGATWATLPGFGSVTLSFIVDPRNPTTLYASTDGGLFKSPDGGQTWTSLESTGGVLTLDPSNSLTLYAGVGSAPTELRSIIKSTNGGASWTTSDRGVIATDVRALALDPTNPRIIYAGTYGSGGLFKSTDRGISWSASNEGITTPYINTIVVDPRNPPIIYAGSGAPAPTMLFKSTNAGKTWIAHPGPEAPGTQVLAIDPLNSRVLYAGAAFSGVYKSIDAGATWQQSGLSGLRVESIVFVPGQSQVLYVAASASSTQDTPYGGVFKSVNDGESWTRLTGGLPDTGYWSVLVAATNSQHLYANGRQGVFTSTDGGTTWTARNNGLLDISDTIIEPFILALDPSDPLIVYAGINAIRMVGERRGIGEVFKSIDGGNSWTEMNSGLPTTAIFALSVDPRTPAILHVGTGGNGVFDISFDPTPPMTISTIVPNFGPTSGGTVVSITGTNFPNGATVTIGGAAASHITVVNSTIMTATTPPGTAGTANVVVTNPHCTGAPDCSATLANIFTYIAPPPTIALSTTTLDFGSVKVGKRRKLSVSVRNISARTQTVTTSTDEPFGLRSSASLVLKPGKEKAVKLRFRPVSTGAASGTLRVESAGSTMTVTLTGIGR